MTRPTAPFALAALLATITLAAPDAGAFAIDHLQDKSDIGRNKVPSAGTSHVLVIPSRVGGNFSVARLAALEEYFNPEGGLGTFREYWKVMSQGRYDPIPFLADPVIFDECPLPGKTVQTCRILLSDINLLATGEVSTALELLISRVRDEQDVDLMQFDVNGATPGEPDGWFDGVILSTDLFDGLGLPLAAFEKEIYVSTTPVPPPPDAGPTDAGLTDAGGLDAGALDAGPLDAGPLDAGPADAGPADAGATDAGPTGPQLGVGVIAFIPPDGHEFGHNLGFMDLYGGPVITGLMGNARSGLSAHSRLVIDWGDEQVVTGPTDDLELLPVLAGGPVLRFGEPPRYVLVENRSGFLHNQTEVDYPGLYVYSVDENELPDGKLGFLDLVNGDLFLPNRPEPKVGNIDCIDECYLNINMPVQCRRVPPDEGNSCTVAGVGARRNIEHADEGHLGYYIEILSRDNDGTTHIAVHEGNVADLVPDDAGVASDAGVLADGGGDVVEDCQCSGTDQSSSAPWSGLCLLAMLAAIRRRRG